MTDAFLLLALPALLLPLAGGLCILLDEPDDFGTFDTLLCSYLAVLILLDLALLSNRFL